ncbi:hypothetical protein B6N17_001350 [Stutzerimonas stutzeri]|uniref:hypothetical protein n=1 Tax=Stutzerimonas stutzeri TaxID=316 RepID=UPI000A0FA145|nr:hypothetical protein [Stutzerimonas stutzeri]OSO75065.1 hypothetical protein B6N17_001350 [Stutzerimonas stutzeri]CAD2266496.1 hypothetical protein PSEUDT2_01591 [Stutzerimonas stutzeri]HBM64458.1 hypothetical protein [Pseudomonas sp.]
MELLQTANSLFGSLVKVVGWLQNRANPARRQAARILEAFETHGFERTQINRLLPADLQLTQFELSAADELKKVIKQPHVDWVADFLALNPDWLDGASEQAHTLVYSYKSPGELQAWFKKHAPRPDDGAIYKLHLLTSDTSAITPASSGYYAVVLEELSELGDAYLSRYYHLTEGARFDHYPSVLHLMQILALAHLNGAIMRRAVLPQANLRRLSLCQGLIPQLLWKAKPHPLEADHEFWGHFSGHSPRLVQLREDTEASLLRAGLHDVVESINHDRQRFAFPQRNTTEKACCSFPPVGRSSG